MMNNFIALNKSKVREKRVIKSVVINSIRKNGMVSSTTKDNGNSNDNKNSKDSNSSNDSINNNSNDNMNGNDTTNSMNGTDNDNKNDSIDDHNNDNDYDNTNDTTNDTDSTTTIINNDNTNSTNNDTITIINNNDNDYDNTNDTITITTNDTDSTTTITNSTTTTNDTIIDNVNDRPSATHVPHMSSIHHIPRYTFLHRLTSVIRTVYQYNKMKQRRTYFYKCKHILESVTKHSIQIDDLRRIRHADRRYVFVRSSDGPEIVGVGDVLDVSNGMSDLYSDDENAENDENVSKNDENVSKNDGNAENDGNVKKNAENEDVHSSTMPSNTMPISTGKMSAKERYSAIVKRIRHREHVRKQSFIAMHSNTGTYSFINDLNNTFSIEKRQCYEYEELKRRMNYVCEIDKEIGHADGYRIVMINGIRYVMKEK